MQSSKRTFLQVCAVVFACALLSGTASFGAAAAEKTSTLDLGNGVTLALAAISAGKFLKGSPREENGHANDEADRFAEKPAQQEVTIRRPFSLGITEVTQAQYEQVIGKNPSLVKGAQLPVDSVSWDEAMQFCQTLSAKTGRIVRLPTEAEWEYACRAGGTSRFYYGDDPEHTQLGDYAWYAANSGGKTQPVARKKPNAWGLYDMAGNVWEWCSDFYGGPYDQKPVTDPAGPAIAPDGRLRILRGGCWETGPLSCRSANRGGLSAGRAASRCGFRVAVESP